MGEVDELYVSIEKVKPKLLKNTSEWRTEAIHFETYGVYTKHPRSENPNSAYYKYWVEQAQRCVYGYTTPSGIYLSGYYYFYLNFSQIKIIEADEGNTITGTEKFSFPNVWDVDYDYFTYLDEAEKSGKNGMVLKKRRAGCSFKAGSMLNRNYFLIPMSNSYAVASSKEFLLGGDGILSKTWDMMDFIDKNTGWAKRRQEKSTDMIRKATYLKNSYGVVSASGYKSSIIGVSTKNDVDKLRGKRAKLILFEEGGTNPLLKQAWIISSHSVKQEGRTFGLMVAFGTGGTEGADFEAMDDMFKNPKKYNILPRENVWEPNALGTESGFFIPAYMCRMGYIDKDGNSDIKGALEEIKQLRQVAIENNSTPEEITRSQAEEPVYPSEAMMRIGGNLFPIADLRKRMAEVDSQPTKYYDSFWRGDFVINEKSEVEFNIDVKKHPIWEFPYYGSDTTGCVIIYEQPVFVHGEIPYGMYIAGTDPYNHNHGASLGSTFILHRLTDRIVAEYTARPLTDEMYYENVRRLLLYYNARCNYENSSTGMHTYMNRMGCLYLLTDTPSVLFDKIHDKGTLDRGKGSPPTEKVNKYARERILAWLMTPLQDGTGLLNLHKIVSIPLLKELMAWSKEGNYDRCLIANTKILTKNGYNNIEDIKIGELVMTKSGLLYEVYTTHKNNILDEIYQLQILGQYNILQCTSNHPILTTSFKKKPQGKNWIKRKEDPDNLYPLNYKRADELKKDDFVIMLKRKNLQEPIFNDELLYLLGWYLSDGWISSKTNVIKIFLHTSQYDIAVDLVKIINKYYKRETTYCNERIDKNGRKISAYYNTQGSTAIVKKSKNSEMYIVEFHSKELNKLLRDYCGGAFNKKLSPMLFNCKNLMPLIKGYFEGDGHYRSHNRCDGTERDTLELATIYVELVTQIRQILLDSGIWCTIRYISNINRSANVQPQVCINITGEHCVSIIEGSKKFKQRKSERKVRVRHYIETENYYLVPIKKVSHKTFIGTVYNISIKTDETYVAENIVTHNCSALGMLMIQREEDYAIFLDATQHVKGVDEDPFWNRSLGMKNRNVNGIDITKLHGYFPGMDKNQNLL